MELRTVAADKGWSMDLRLKLSSHREQISLFLGLLSATLGRSANLCLQSLDTRLDSTLATQERTQNSNTSHFENITQGIQTLSITQGGLHAQAAGISNSTESIRDTLDSLQRDQAESKQLNTRYCERLDEVLLMIQQSLLSPTPSKPSRRNLRKS